MAWKHEFKDKLCRVNFQMAAVEQRFSIVPNTGKKEESQTLICDSQSDQEL